MLSLSLPPLLAFALLFASHINTSDAFGTMASKPATAFIDKLALILIQNRQQLVVRSRGKEAFFTPGGKREEGESDEDALCRECKEELTIDIKRDSIKPFGVFQAQAFGKPEGTMVRMTCYQADFTGDLKASAEIEELKWISSDFKDPLASGRFDMGWSISLSAGGTVLVCSNYYIGSEGHIDSANANDGHTHDDDAGDEGLYVQSFHLMNGEWTAMGGNMHSHTMGPRSGYVVSISDDGRTIGMGDPGRAGNGKASGHAHVYRYHGSMWHHSHEDHWMIVEGDILGMAAGDAFGHTVALSRNSRRFAVGAPYNRNQGFEHGRVRIFDIVDI